MERISYQLDRESILRFGLRGRYSADGPGMLGVPVGHLARIAMTIEPHQRPDWLAQRIEKATIEPQEGGGAFLSYEEIETLTGLMLGMDQDDADDALDEYEEAVQRGEKKPVLPPED